METKQQTLQVNKQGASYRCALIRGDLNILCNSTNNQTIRKKIDTVKRHLCNLQISIIKSTKEDWYEQRKT